MKIVLTEPMTAKGARCLITAMWKKVHRIQNTPVSAVTKDEWAYLSSFQYVIGECRKIHSWS